MKKSKSLKLSQRDPNEDVYHLLFGKPPPNCQPKGEPWPERNTIENHPARLHLINNDTRTNHKMLGNLQTTDAHTTNHDAGQFAIMAIHVGGQHMNA